MHSRKSLCLFAAVTIAVWVSINPVMGATIFASNLNDNGAGSLRSALSTAMSGDTIDCTTLSGTIVLTGGQLIIINNLTIIGPGSKALAISGNAANRVFDVPPGVTVTISGLTITNGTVAGGLGGGILNDHSTLTLTDCAIRGNSAQNGAGIYNNGASSGAAVLTLVNCTISSNTAGSIGGAIVNGGGNTGTATLAMTNCTLIGNSGSVGGIYNNGANSGHGTLNIFSCTLSGNSGTTGGAIYNESLSGSAIVEAGNSIFKRGAAGANLGNDSGTYISHGYNLSSDSAGGDATHGPGGFLNATGDQRNTDPLLDSAGLRDNGGNTLTVALLPGSPAIDSGNSFGLAGDQRGRARPFDILNVPNATGGNGTDIGAFELVPPALAVVRLGDNIIVSWPSPSPGFRLQLNTDLTNGNGWADFAGTINDDGTNKSISVAASGALFFRLH